DGSWASGRDGLNAWVQMRFVTLADAGENRDVHVAPSSGVQQGAQVLRQAGPAEREARPEIRGGNVELRVHAHEIHHGVSIDFQRLADSADLIGKGDFQRMEGVARVLEHL